MKLKINIAFLSYQIGKNPKIWQYTVSETVRRWLPLYSAGRNPAPPVPIEVHLSVSSKIIDTFIYWLSNSMSRVYLPGTHVCACVRACCRFSHVRLFVTLWTVASCQASPSMGFSRPEYWSGLPCPPPGDLPNPGTEPMAPVSSASQVDSLPISHWGSPRYTYTSTKWYL